ncbi:unnamed protein product [Coregonus sp. 'balchen']|nr:unnamed protein product [Coregonus sp. 'balchen']
MNKMPDMLAIDAVLDLRYRRTTPMVYLTVAQCEGRSIKLGSSDVMFDASTWRIRNIWDGVKLEVAGDVSPVVLHSFTQLDPDLPQLEL